MESIFSEIKNFNKSLINDTTTTFSSETDVLSENYTFGNNIYDLFTALGELFTPT